MPRYGILSLGALACLATTATAQSRKRWHPEERSQLPPEIQHETRWKYWEEKKNEKTQSAEEKARTAAAQAHA